MGIIPEFQCLNCGDCCKDVTPLIPQPSKESTFLNDNVFELKSPYLTFYPYEKNILMKELKREKIELVPCFIIYDLKANQTIVISYTNTSSNCLFLSNENECKIYDKRPIICKSFPVTVGGLELNDITWTLNSSKCKNDLSLKELKNIIFPELRKNTAMKNLYIRYKESYLAQLFIDVYTMMISKNLEILISDGIIKPATRGYNENFLKVRIERSEFIDEYKLLERYLDLNIKQIVSSVEDVVNETEKWLKSL